MLAARQDYARIFRGFQHARAVGQDKFLPRERNYRLLLLQGAVAVRSAALKARCEARQAFLEFAAKDRAHAEAAQVFLVHRSVESVKAKVSARILFTDFRNEARRKPRGRVHRHIKGNQIRGEDGFFVERFARQIEARDIVPASAQPCGR